MPPDSIEKVDGSWAGAFPALTALEPDALALLRAQGTRMTVPRETPSRSETSFWVRPWL